MTRLIASLTALVTLLMAVFGICGVKDTDITPDAWMTDISDSAYISEISIPGTHDSGALYEPVQPSAKCQSSTIADQLDMGVRFLDMRCVISGCGFNIVHGVVYQAQTFDDVLDTCGAFLRENPTETIIMSVKPDLEKLNSVRLFTKILKKYIDKSPDMWYTDDAIPTMGQVRGKIVLFNRFDPDCGLGLNAADWPENTSFIISNNGYNIHVQDYYKIESTDKEWGYIESLLQQAYYETEKPANLYVNFLSGYSSKILPNPPDVAQDINPRFAGFISSAPKGCFGIILFDFVTPELCRMLINTNF
ncbi:MAG: phosphatidylinositol-specific phospholipase C [Oscillospiraceae bacterium]|nr:phosphatidylinositol-specific phospholipase C [Oscillospiraceae bacterium]